MFYAVGSRTGRSRKEAAAAAVFRLQHRWMRVAEMKHGQCGFRVEVTPHVGSISRAHPPCTARRGLRVRWGEGGLLNMSSHSFSGDVREKWSCSQGPIPVANGPFPTARHSSQREG